MYARAISNADVKMTPTELSVYGDLGRPAASLPMAISSLQRKAPGETLFVEGEAADSVYEIVHGMLRLYKLLPDGRRLITGFVSTGHFLDLAPEDICTVTAEAITEVTLCRYKRAAFEHLIDEVPGFAKRLLTAAAHELHVAQDQMVLLGRKTAAEKVASFLLLMADQQGDELRAIQVPMSRSDMADHLGLTVETISRTLSWLKRRGLIALPVPVRIEICDRDRLEELAAGGCEARL